MERIQEEKASVIGKYGEKFRCYGNPKPECLETFSIIEKIKSANWLLEQIPEPCKTCMLKYGSGV
ncbi:MAG: hypothetical protein QW332_06150 [Thermoproteota archaeon]